MYYDDQSSIQQYRGEYVLAVDGVNPPCGIGFCDRLCMQQQLLRSSSHKNKTGFAFPTFDVCFVRFGAILTTLWFAAYVATYRDGLTDYTIKVELNQIYATK